MNEPTAPGPTLSLQSTEFFGSRSTDTSSTPARIGPYEILEEIARGGMGVVYRARQSGLNRVVALKMILAGGQAGAAERDRFRVEAETVAQLQHPHIVRVIEIGEHEGQLYQALEFCSGGTLAKKLAGTPLPAREAATLIEKLARAMQAAHARGIIHRDLKPANVLFDEAGEPKVGDFGLAKLLDRDDGQTRTGAIMGTPSYMAPEQASGQTQNVGPPWDVYALGAILYECLTGRPPFKGATLGETLDQVRTRDPVPVRQLNPSVARDLETIALKCLRKEPEKRYASAADLAAELRRFLEGQPILARPVGRVERSWRWARRNPVLALVSALLLLVLTGAVVGASLAAGWFHEQAQAASVHLENYTRAIEALDRAQVYIGQGDYVGALAAHDEAVQRRPDLAEFWMARARFYLLLGMLDEAASDVEEAFARQESAHPAAWYYRVLLKRYKGDEAGSRAVATTMRKRFGEKPSAAVAALIFRASIPWDNPDIDGDELRHLADLARNEFPFGPRTSEFDYFTRKDAPQPYQSSEESSATADSIHLTFRALELVRQDQRDKAKLLLKAARAKTLSLAWNMPENLRSVPPSGREWDTRNTLQAFRVLDRLQESFWYTEAARALEQPDDSLAGVLDMQRAEGLWQLNRWEECDRLLEQAATALKESPLVPLYRLQVLAHLGRTAEMPALAREILRRSWLPRPRAPVSMSPEQILVHSAKALASSGLYAAAVDLIPVSDKPQIYCYLRAHYLTRAAKYDEAATEFDRLFLLRLEPARPGGPFPGLPNGQSPIPYPIPFPILQPPGPLSRDDARLRQNPVGVPIFDSPDALILDAATERAEVYERLSVKNVHWRLDLGLARGLRLAATDPEAAAVLIAPWLVRAGETFRAGVIRPERPMALIVQQDALVERLFALLPANQRLYYNRLNYLTQKNDWDRAVALTEVWLERKAGTPFIRTDPFYNSIRTAAPIFLNGLIERRPQDIRLRLLQVEQAFGSSDRKRALQAVEAALAALPDTPELILALDDLLAQFGERQRAGELSAELVRKFPDRPDYWRHRITMAAHLEDAPAVVQAARKMLELVEAGKPGLTRSEFYQFAQTPEMAKALPSLVAARPDDDGLLNALCAQLRKLSPDRAAPELEKLAQRRLRSPFLAEAGQLYLRCKNLDAAARVYRQALAQDPSRFAPGFRENTTLRVEIATQGELFDHLRADKVRDPWLDLERAAILEGQRRYPEAEKLLDELIELLPEDPETWLERAQFYRAGANLDRSVRDYEAALRLLKPTTRAGVVWRVCESAASNDGVFERLDRSIPNNANLWAGRAVELFRRGNKAGSLALLNRAVKLRPDDAKLHFQRASSLSLFGRWQEAGPDFLFAAGRLDYGEDEFLAFRITVGLAVSQQKQAAKMYAATVLQRLGGVRESLRAQRVALIAAMLPDGPGHGPELVALAQRGYASQQPWHRIVLALVYLRAGQRTEALRFYSNLDATGCDGLLAVEVRLLMEAAAEKPENRARNLAALRTQLTSLYANPNNPVEPWQGFALAQVLLEEAELREIVRAMK